MFERYFPILKRKINSRRLVYLDNASTTQKPSAVLRAISDFYKKHNANIHRGIYKLSLEATELYEGARDKIQKFINTKHREEIIFTSGATEAINLVVWTWGHENIQRGDEILLTEMEHHSNLVPWQVLAKKKGARLRFIPIHNSPNPSYLKRGTPSLSAKGGSASGGKIREGGGELFTSGHLDLSQIDHIITRRTKILALTHISNVLGTINPIKEVVKFAHKKGVKVLVDGAQAGGHVKIDVQKLDCDFYVLSGHKMYGPTGVGILYGRRGLLEKMPPYQYGGHMIKRVNWTYSTWNDLPYKFEAGTANIAEVIGLGAAIDFINQVGLKNITQHEKSLTAYSLELMTNIPGLAIYGPQTTKDRIGVISFNIADIPPHDLASILDERGIAIRVGHHCAMPLHEKLGIDATARISLGIYNTKADIDALIEGIKQAIKIFQPLP